MEIYQLQSFVTVAREKHLTRAAEKRNVSQPAVSAHIKALEEEVGLSLFHRTPKGMQLTADGKLLCKKAQKILQQVDEFTRLGESLTHQPAGVIRIGLNRDAEFLRVQPLYQQLRSKHPHLEIILHQAVSSSILKSIRANELDCGFVLGGSRSDDLSPLHLARYTLNVVGPVALRNEIEEVDLAQLAALPWIGIPDGCPYSQIMEQFFHAHGFYPKTEVVADQQSTIVSMIKSGVGLNFMLEEEAQLAKEQGKVAIWQKGSFPIGLFFVHRTKDEHSPLLQAVKKTIAAIWPQVDLPPQTNTG